PPSTPHIYTLSLHDALPISDAVQKIFIHLDRRSPTARFDRYGARLVPIYNYFQAALVLVEERRLDADAAIRVALEMVDKFGYTLDRKSTRLNSSHSQISYAV